LLNSNESTKSFEFFESLFFSKLEEVYTSQPATILKFDAKELTLEVRLDKEGIVLKDIPITLFGNPKSYITTTSMEKGTKGLLIFSKHDLMDWVEDGTDEHAKTDHALNNAFFLTGVTNKKNKIAYNLNALEIVDDKEVLAKAPTITFEAKKQITLKSPSIALTNEADELFALNAELCNELSSLSGILSKHTGLSAVSPFIAKFTSLSDRYKGFT